jgi:integrase
MLQSHVVKRAAHYYFRIAVPLPLTRLLGRREFKVSLRTSDAILAKMRGRVLSNALELIFRRLRPMAEPSTEEILGRAKDYFRRQISKSLELAFLLPTDPAIDIDFEIAGAQQLATEMQIALSKQQFSASVQSDARELLNLSKPNTASDAFQLACNAILRANIENAKQHAAQLAGQYDRQSVDPWFAGICATDLPPIPGEPAKAVAKGPTFDFVAKQFFAFKSKEDWAPKTAADVKRVMALASELIGPDKPMEALNIDDVKRVRDAVALLPPNYTKMTAKKGFTAIQAIEGNVAGPSLSVKTQDKYFTMFRQLLIWAENEGFLNKVPGANVKIGGLNKLVPGDQRDPYSKDQLSKIFQSPLYAGHKSEDCRHKPGTLCVRDGYFWVPLIALFSGMRLGEIVQLLKSDVKQDNEIWYFDVSKGEGKSLKTASSKRRVPVHHALIELGFLEHVKSCSSGRIFTEIKQGADGYHSHNISKWWSRYARQVGFKTDRTTFHSFRHNFLDALHATNSAEYLNKALMGHADKSVHGGYGSGATLASLKEAIDKITYAMDLSHLDAG